MPILKLDYPEPFLMTLGTMLYPGLDDGDVARQGLSPPSTLRG